MRFKKNGRKMRRKKNQFCGIFKCFESMVFNVLKDI